MTERLNHYIIKAVTTPCGHLESLVIEVVPYMYELIKNINASRAGLNASNILLNSPINSNCYSVWRVINSGGDDDRVYLYDRLNADKLNQVVDSSHNYHYEVNAIQAFKPKQSDTALAVRQEVYRHLDQINPQWCRKQWSVPGDKRDVCMSYVKTDCDLSRTDLVLAGLDVVTTVFCIEKLQNNCHGSAPDLLRKVLATYHSANHPRFVALYGIGSAMDSKTTEMYLFDCQKESELYVRKTSGGKQCKVFVRPVGHFSMVRTIDMKQIRATACQHLPGFGDTYPDKLKLIHVAYNMHGVNDVRLYLDI